MNKILAVAVFSMFAMVAVVMAEVDQGLKPRHFLSVAFPSPDHFVAAQPMLEASQQPCAGPDIAQAATAPSGSRMDEGFASCNDIYLFGGYLSCGEQRPLFNDYLMLDFQPGNH